MSEHFNKLNPAEHEILTKLSEESAEIIKAVCKSFLHGLDSCEPGTSAPSNREKIENELGDLLFFMGLAIDQGLLNSEHIGDAFKARAHRKNHYLHHVCVD